MTRWITRDELRAAVGTEVAASGWYPVTQERIRASDCSPPPPGV